MEKETQRNLPLGTQRQGYGKDHLSVHFNDQELRWGEGERQP